VIETGAADLPGDKSGYNFLLRQTLASLPEGTWELVCHPGYSDAESARNRPRACSVLATRSAVC